MTDKDEMVGWEDVCASFYEIDEVKITLTCNAVSVFSAWPRPTKHRIISVQAEIFLLSDPTFLKGFDLSVHMLGHFPHGMLFSFVTCPFAQKIGKKQL